jgi:hypothetical protein
MNGKQTIYAYQVIDTRFGKFDLKLFSTIDALVEQLVIKDSYKITKDQLVTIMLEHARGKWITASNVIDYKSDGVMFQITDVNS